MSLPEVLLWQTLRRRPQGFKFRRQHPVGGYVVDFACLSAKLLIEVDGEVHSGDDQARVDALRQSDLEAKGLTVIRIAARDVLNETDAVVRMIVAQCEAGAPLHQPSAGPPPRFGEDSL